jgi:hypothetical protein
MTRERASRAYFKFLDISSGKFGKKKTQEHILSFVFQDKIKEIFRESEKGQASERISGFCIFTLR